MVKQWRAVTIAALCLASAGAWADDAAPSGALAKHFGFGEMEIYRIKRGIDNLRLADLNSDQRTDVVLWNAEQSRFEFFFQPDADSPAAADDASRERNEPADRGRMVRKNLPVNYKVASLDVGDFNNDGKLDIVFFGEPKELVVVPQKENGEFGTPEGVRAPDGNPRRSSLAVGDYNDDGRADVALLGAELLLIFQQRESGGFGAPQRLVHGIRNPTMMLRGDLDGDGRDDLAIGADDDRYGMYVCLQESSGTMAAFRPVRIPRVRGITIVPAAGDAKGDDVYAVELATNRLIHYRWQIPQDTSVVGDWPQRLHSYPVKSSSKLRPLALGDVDGDGRIDCVTADPDAAQMILFRGEAEGLGAGLAFPGLMKTSDVQIADVDGDGKAEILLASGEEKLLAVSRYDDGRLTYPTPLAAQGEPYAAAVGSLRVGERADHLFYVSKSDDEYALRIRPTAGGDERVLKIADVDEDPAGLRLVDLDQDGDHDILLFIRFSEPQAFLQKDDGSFELFSGSDKRTSLLKQASLPGFASVDVTGDGKPEILLAQEGFVRALTIREGRWTVVDQYNPEAPDARMTGVAAIPGEAGEPPTIVAYERKGGDLVVFRPREDKTYAVSQTMPVTAFDLAAMDVLPIGADGAPALLLADVGKLAVFRPDERAPTLVAQHSYESEQRDAWLADAVVGDANGDGVRDVAAVDLGRAAIELLTTLPDGEMKMVMRFQVFQGRRFRDAPESRGEPREVLMGELTGDDRDDVVLLVHDRLIIYPGQ